MNALNGFIRMSQSWVEAWAVHEEGRGGDALTAFSSPQILDLRYQNL